MPFTVVIGAAAIRNQGEQKLLDVEAGAVAREVVHFDDMIEDPSFVEQINMHQ